MNYNWPKCDSINYSVFKQIVLLIIFSSSLSKSSYRKAW